MAAGVIDQAPSNFSGEFLNSISPLELAKVLLMDKDKNARNISRDDIDSLIDLIARCSWRLELAKVQFPLWIRRQVMAEDFTSIQKQSDELNKNLEKIEKANEGRIPFQQGLVKMIPDPPRSIKSGSNDKKREDLFLRYFTNRFKYEIITEKKFRELEGQFYFNNVNDWHLPIGGFTLPKFNFLMRSISLKGIPEDCYSENTDLAEKSIQSSTKDLFDELKNRGWHGTLHFLEWRESFNEWWVQERKVSSSEAGRKSVASRKAKKAENRTKRGARREKSK